MQVLGLSILSHPKSALFLEFLYLLSKGYIFLYLPSLSYLISDLPSSHAILDTGATAVELGAKACLGLLLKL